MLVLIFEHVCVYMCMYGYVYIHEHVSIYVLIFAETTLPKHSRRMEKKKSDRFAYSNIKKVEK